MDLESFVVTTKLGDEAMNGSTPRICIVCQNASYKFGGEASLPWLCFKYLRQREVDVHLVAHQRIGRSFWRDFQSITTGFIFRPTRSSSDFCGVAGSCCRRKSTIRRLWPYGISRTSGFSADRPSVDRGEGLANRTRDQSCIAQDGEPDVRFGSSGGDRPTGGRDDLSTGIPVYGFRAAARAVETMGRTFSHFVNWLIPGKRRAAGLIVANDQTRDALPVGVTGKIFEMPDVGVDLEVWNEKGKIASREDEEIQFVYLGRLSYLKGLQFLIPAFKALVEQEPRAVLYIMGDGKERKSLEELTCRLNLSERVKFVGWVSAEEGAERLRSADVFVFPSLREVGGIVLLEAMAVGLPVITTKWGGPAIHVTDETGNQSEAGFKRWIREGAIRGYATAGTLAGTSAANGAGRKSSAYAVICMTGIRKRIGCWKSTQKCYVSDEARFGLDKKRQRKAKISSAPNRNNLSL